MKESEKKAAEEARFFVLRGYRSCLANGWRFAALHARSFLLQTLLPAVAIALLTAYVGAGEKVVTVPAFYHPIPVYPVEKLVLYGVAALLVLLLWVTWKGYYYTVARHVVAGNPFPTSRRSLPAGEWRTNSLRYLQSLLLLSLVVVPLVGGSWYLHRHAPEAFFWCLFVLIPVSVYLFPLFSLVEANYMMGESTFRRALWQTLTDGTRNWGRVFLVYLLSRSVALAGIVAFGLQAAILSALVWSSEQAMALGDAATIPAYVYWLEYAGWFVAALATLLFSWIRLTPMLYQYGSLTIYGKMQAEMRTDKAALEQDSAYMRSLLGGQSDR